MKKNKSKEKKIHILAITITISIFLAIFLIKVAVSWHAFVKNPIAPQEKKPVDFLYSRGESAIDLALKLKRENLLEKPIFFIILAYTNKSWKALKVGEYTINPGTSPEKLLQAMMKGETKMHSFTIIEGETFHKIKDALRKNPYITHTIEKLSDKKIMQIIDHNCEVPEGRFAADTYLFHAGIKDTVLLQKAYKNMHVFLSKAWIDRDPKAPYKSPYEALIAASIIEKETEVKNERFKISGVILQRIRKNMRLDLDPTVIYGLRKDFNFKGKLTRALLRKDTAYNTYLHRGLPPTPISTPSQESIIAALHPESCKELFYVRGERGHIFSKTLKEHNTAIEKYLLKKNLKPKM